LIPILVPLLAAVLLGIANALVRTAAQNPSRLLGGEWDRRLYEASRPTCSAGLEAVPYRARVKTGFLTHPRSGNTYTRELVERATGFQTSSVWCDR